MIEDIGGALLAQIGDMIRNGTLNQSDVLSQLSRAGEAGAYRKEILMARDEWEGDSIEIDDEPLVSPADKGCWVSAWVWVQYPYPEEGC